MKGIPPPLEKAVELEVRRVLTLYGFDVSKLSQGYRPGGERHGTTRQTPGIPDLYVRHRVWKLRFWVEVKRPGAKVEPDGNQARWHELEREAGGQVLVVHSGAEMQDWIYDRILTRPGDPGWPSSSLQEAP